MSYRVLGIAGSLRRESFNRAALNKARELTSHHLTIDIFDIGQIPLYNGDVENEGMPDAVHELRQAIHVRDALLFVTPEYNFSVPGVLKNAIDWASRAYDPKLARDDAKWPSSPPNQPFRGKPIGIMGASLSLMGTVRSQTHLRQVLAALGAYVMPQPEVFISDAMHKFTAGHLTDQKTLDVMMKFLNAFESWIRKFALVQEQS
jgi:chromate reductase